MNDWPTSTPDLVDEFLVELMADFAPLTYENIRAGAARLNLATDAWKAEGLTELLAAWSMDNRDKTLQELLDGLSSASADE